jgi:hypothetical protein
MPKLLLPLAAVGLGAAGTTAVFQSREKKKAQERVEQFQSSEKKDWDRFTDNTARKSFVKQLGADPMTDPKLLQYADSMNRLKTGKRIADIPGDGGKSYQITKLRGSERLGCTCNDWRYKKSVAQPGEAQDCKHIQQFKEMSKTGSVLPSFLDMDKHEGFIDPRSDDFNKNRAFGLGLGAALPGAAFGALYSGAVKDRSLPKSVALTAAGGLATGVPVGLLALKDFRELQAEGKNPVTGKAHDIAKIKKSQEWARKRYHQMNKTAAARFQDNLPNPVIDGKPHDGTWTIVGSGRLSIPKKTSDIDYMVPLEEIGDLSSFNEYKDVPGAYWKDLDPVKGRPATVVAVPRYAYDKIDASYQQAVDRFGKRKLRQLKKTLPKDSFYKDIGVVYTSDAMKKEAGHVEDRIAERAPGAEPEVNTLRAKLRNMKLRKGQTYHIPLKRGRGYAVVGDAGDRHVVKTVLGPSMRPPGERLKVARAPRDYKKEYDEYHAKPEQVENRSLRNQARRKLGLKKGDPREADHKTPLSKGGGNGHRNLRAVSRETNRSKFTKEAEADHGLTAGTVAPGAVGLTTGAALMSGLPQRTVGRLGVRTVKSYGSDMSDEEMRALSDKYNVAVTRGAKSSATRDGITLGGGTGNKQTFLHELGHYRDRGIIDTSDMDKSSLKYTLSKLRNEAVANINAVRLGGLKQIPHALGSYGSYLASGAVRHKKGLSGLAAGTGVAASGVLLHKKQSKSSDPA